jgi:hypothetical protein
MFVDPIINLSRQKMVKFTEVRDSLSSSWIITNKLMNLFLWISRIGLQ